MKLVENKLFLIMEDPVELSVINFLKTNNKFLIKK